MKNMILLLICVMAFITAPISAHGIEERMIGLITLPQVFGDEPCDKFSPETISVFDSPGRSDPIALILVTTNWKFQPEGGCVGLEVTCQFTEGGKPGKALPSKEFDYENPAAIVVERKGDWFRIMLPNGTGWFRASPKNRYHPLEELLTSHIPYLTENWDGLLYEKPIGKLKKETAKPNTAVRILSMKRIEDQLWFKIKIPVENACGDIDVTISETIGWIPAYSKNNQSTLWFNSRGC